MFKFKILPLLLMTSICHAHLEVGNKARVDAVCSKIQDRKWKNIAWAVVPASMSVASAVAASTQISRRKSQGRKLQMRVNSLMMRKACPS